MSTRTELESNDENGLVLVLVPHTLMVGYGFKLCGTIFIDLVYDFVIN